MKETENENLLVENFVQYTYTEEDGTELMYSLYLPEDYDENTGYPLVLFMPDATGEGDDPYLALTESLGGVIWTTDSWQEDNPCIVLVPQYTEDNTEDDSYTMALAQEIMDSYSVDEDRVYLVGQSSGAMLVAGQADSAYEDQLASLAKQNIWFICSEKDARAYPDITEIVEAVEGAGTEVPTSQWSAKLSDAEQEENAKEQEEAGTRINWTVFDGNTVMESNIESSDATEHMNTWRIAYSLDTIREWLFAQTRS